MRGIRFLCVLLLLSPAMAGQAARKAAAAQPVTPYALGRQADQALRDGDTQAAIRLAERAYAQLRDTREDNPSVLYSIGLVFCSIASYYDEKEDYATAQPLHARCVTILESLQDSGAEWLELWREQAALNAVAQGKFALAAEYFERQISEAEKRPQPLSAGYAFALAQLSLWRAYQGNAGEAVRLWQRLLTLRTEVFGDSALAQFRGLRELALLNELAGRENQALALRTDADLLARLPATVNPPEPEGRLQRILKLPLPLLLAKVWDANRFDTEFAPDDIRRAQRYAQRAMIAEADWDGIAGNAAEYWKQALALRVRLQGAAHADTRRTAEQLAAALGFAPTRRIPKN